VVKAMTYRKGGIYQHATIGGNHPWYTDNMLQLPALEADIFGALKSAGLNVLEVRCPAGGLSNIAYAKIKPNGAGDAKQALGLMLTCSKLALPKVAMVFDDDVDIWDDDAIRFAMAFRYMPHVDTVMIPGCNTMTVDPMIAVDDAPGSASKIGFDCTIPMGPKYIRNHFDRSTAFVPPDPPSDVTPLTEEQCTAAMEALIDEAPRTWKEILLHFNGQPYPVVYRAFSNLRPRLGRCDDAPWYRYTFSDSDFAAEVPEPKPSNFDPRHRPTD
jgi:4-hydroxy-3-polyprenylbenzoate decarboxylase